MKSEERRAERTQERGERTEEREKRREKRSKEAAGVGRHALCPLLRRGSRFA